jgi:hypothetical protein
MARMISQVKAKKTEIPEGDARYLAKELLTIQLNRQQIDLKKADIYALGATAFELIEGIKLKT